MSEWEKEFDNKLDEWLESDAHKYECTAYGEGQYCCLEAEHNGKARDIIKTFFRQKEKEIREEYEKKIEELNKQISEDKDYILELEEYED